MNPLTLQNGFFSPLFVDAVVARVFSAERTAADFLGFEAALAEALGALGLADPAGRRRRQQRSGFRPDMARWRRRSPRTGWRCRISSPS